MNNDQNKKYLIEDSYLMSEWDFEKNDPVKLSPSKLTLKSNKKAWWKCEKGHSWEATIYDRSSGQNCPYCSNRRVLIGYNDLQTTHPELVREWNYEKNQNISPLKITSGSAKKAWWTCSTCGNEWETSIRQRTQRNSNCPKCALIKRTKTRRRTFVEKNGCITDEKLLKEWNYEKNAGLRPENFTRSSSEKVWWKCQTCSYEWQSTIINRTYGRNCPSCSNRVLIKGKNDLLTVAPELAKEWHPTKNLPLAPDGVSLGSGIKVWWLCPNGHEYPATILHRGHGTNCPECSSGRQTSFAEQTIYYYIKKIFPDAVNRCKDIIGNRMELDIYIPSICLAIEYDGIYWHKSKSTAKEREEIKYRLCKEKGITLWRIREEKNGDKIPTTILTGEAINDHSIKADCIFYVDDVRNRKDLERLILDVFSKLKNFLLFT